MNVMNNPSYRKFNINLKNCWNILWWKSNYWKKIIQIIWKKQNMWVNWFMFFSSSCFLVIFYTLSNSVSLVILVLLHSSILDSLLCVVCCVFLFRSFVCLPVCMFVYVLLPVSECFLWVFCCCEPYTTSRSLSLCIFKQCYCKGLNVRDVVRLT